MKYNFKTPTFIALLAILTTMFSFATCPKIQKANNYSLQDTTASKTIIINDSLKIVGNLKLKLLKKNGHASYYADKFTGRRTASGKIFNNNKYTAAHRKLPFGTKVKVTNEANNKSVIVEITDRGPFIKGRDIDLSKKAFMDIASKRYGGSLKVMIEVIK